MYRSLNIELAEKVLKQVTEHPETHNQEEWGYRAPSCGTQACLAGWAVHFTYPDLVMNWRSGPYGEEGAETASSVTLDGRRVSIADLAAQVLNLDEADADDLFLTLDRESAIELLEQYIEEAKACAASAS